eukprot:m.151351 g.151351  ORF g.151351 m.151351 type:complete len:2129 (-) comp30753_c2_seq1:123-6509(-)
MAKREFAQHINRAKPAKEMRNEVAVSIRHRGTQLEGTTTDEPSNADKLLDTGAWPSYLSDPPPAYEKLLKSAEISNKIARDPLRNQLLLFPDDDWSLVRLKQEFRTVEIPVAPTFRKPTMSMDEIPAELRQCATAYLCDSFRVERKYVEHTQNFEKEMSPVETTLSTFGCDEEQEDQTPDPNRLSYMSRQLSAASSDLDLAKDQDDLAVWMLNWNAKESPRKYQKARETLQDRVPLLSTLDTQEGRKFRLRRLGTEIAPFQDPSLTATKFLVSLAPFEIYNPAVAPELMYGAVCLYDCKQEKQISEMYYTNLTSDATLREMLLANVKDVIRLKEDLKETLTKKRMESKGANMVRDLILPSDPDSLSLSDLLPTDAASLLQDEETVKLATLDPKLLEDDLSRQIIEYAAMRQIVRKYRRETYAKAIFSISQESYDDVFIMIRIEKILEGDPTKAFDLYCKASGADDSTLKRTSSIMEEHKDKRKELKVGEQQKSRREFVNRFYRRLGEYRMPFAWAAVPLLDAASICVGELQPAVEPDIYQQVGEKQTDDELFRTLQDLAKKSADRTITKKLKKIPGSLKVKAVKLDTGVHVPRTLTSGLLRVKPWEEGKDVSLEIREFPAAPVRIPHTTYRHDLFVYPKSILFENSKFRNIACTVEYLESPAEATSGAQEKSTTGVRRIYDRCCQADKLTSITTPINYHTKTPAFYEEVKIALPEKITKDHHLLFTFHHIRCKEKQKREKSPSDIIGYAWHPLVNAKNRMKSGELVVSIASEIPVGYLTSGKAKWIDAKKAELCLNIRLDSTVLADDLMVQGFMLSTEEYLTLNTGPNQSAPNEINLATGVRNLRDADALSLMQFLPVILNQLIFLLKNCSRGQVLGQEAFIALCHVVATAHEHQSVPGTRSPELSSYIKFVHHIYGFEGRARANGTGVLHEEILFWLMTAITTYSSNSSRVHETSAYRTCLTHTWFFLELMIKSLAQCLELECKPRLGRSGNLRTAVSQKFTDGLSRVILELVASVTVDDPPDLLVKDWKTRLISAVGFALRDLFTYIDRSVCFNLIHDVFKLLHAKSANGLNDVTVSYRLDLLEIICSHEHYVPLNLPIEQKSKPHTRLSKEYLQRHYLVGLLLSEVKIMLDSTYSEIRAEAISLVGRVLAMHDKDARYQDEVLQHRVYMLYFPMISIVLEYNAEFSVPHLPDDVVSLDETTSAPLARTPIELTESESVDLLALFLHIISRVKPSTFRSWWKAIVPKSRERLLYLVKLAVYGLSYQGKQSIRVTAAHGDASMGSILRKQLTQNQSQTANALANRYQGGGTGGIASRTQTSNAARTRPQSAVINTNSQGVAVRKHAANTLRNRGDAAQSMHSGDLRSERARLATISTGSNARLPVRNAKAMAKISGKSVKLITRYASETNLADRSSISNEERYVKTGLRASEVDLIALDLVDAFIEDFEDQLMIREYKQLLTHLTQVLLAVMRTNVSHGLVVHLFRVLQSFVFRFPKMLFGEDENKEAGRADICGDLCEHTMRFCASRVKSIRELASAFLYLLMRQNFQQKSKKDFARVKVQVTIALSRLLRPSESENIQNIDINVRRSLATILAFNNKNPSKNYTFPEDVKNLIMNLYTIQRDTSYIREFGESDSEMLIDVHYRIADGYKNSPRIRMEWLKTLSELHTKYDQHAEAGFCMIHSAAILAEKIADFHPREELPKGCVGLVSLSINVLEESLTGDAQKIKDAEDESTFDADKLEDVLLNALKSFQAARMYEYMISVYKLLIPIYEASKNYEKLQRVYGKIQGRVHGETLTMSECYQLILDEEKQRKRYFGTFYRIGFYCKGELLPPDIRNQEFVSREPSLTSLAACSLRLKDQYERYCQSDDVSVEIIQEPHVIDQTKLEPKKVYIQITFVEPCIEQKFGEKRVTIFEQNTSVSSFFFETPFTDSGKSRGDIEHQKLLRTTIKVEKKRSFPYIKKRLKVHSYETITLSPIEFAIDSIEKKITELEMVVQSSEDGVFDLKYLQLKLQGIVMVTVNEGPEAMARVFLSDNPDKPADDKRLVRKLKQKFKLFLELCEKSLVLNEAHITEDQNEYHATLKGGYERLASAIQPLVSNKPSGVSPSPRTKVVSTHSDVKDDDSEI